MSLILAAGDLTAKPILQRLWQTEFLGRQAVLKQRFNKKYRHPTLDTKLTNTRLKQVSHLPALQMLLVTLTPLHLLIVGTASLG